MNKRLGMAMVMTLAGAAWAGENARSVDSSAAPERSATVPSIKATDSSTTLGTTTTSPTGTKDSSAAPMAGNELTGRVVRTDNSKIYIEHMGAVIPLKITSETKFQDQSARRAKDLKEGQEVRAQFRVENKIDNLALVIGTPSTGTGGSGTAGDEQPMNDTLNQGSTSEHEVIPDSTRSTLPSDPGSTTPLPEEPGTAPSPRY